MTSQKQQELMLGKHVGLQLRMQAIGVEKETDCSMQFWEEKTCGEPFFGGHQCVIYRIDEFSVRWNTR